MRRFFSVFSLGLLVATPLAAQPVEFDPADFGKIVVAARQSAGTGIVLEQAFGDYQNEPVITYGEKSIARRLGHPVGRLDVLYKNGKTGYCTAFIVDTQHLVTNHHCIPGVGGVGAQAAQFVAGYIDPANPADAEKFQVALEPVESNAALDYSVLRVFGDPSARYGEVMLADADPEPSEFLWIIGHPQGQSQHISREGCAAGDPPVSTEGKVVHTCDTLGGNSGSPVFRISDRMVVALHHAGDNRTGFNFAIPMTRILKNSKVLKAAVPAGPVGSQGPQGACEVLWGAAQEHGCLGYQTFVQQCGDHPLAALARGLAERSCTQAGVDKDPGKAPGTETPKTDLTAAIAEAQESTDRRRRNVELDLDAARVHQQIVTNILSQMEREKSAAETLRDPGAAEIVALWEETLRDTRRDGDWIKSRVGSMPRFLSQIDSARGAIDRAQTEAELAVAMEDVDTAAKGARDWLTAIAARRKLMDMVYPDTTVQAALILQGAAGGAGPDTPTLEVRIEEALAQAAEARVQIETNAVSAQRLLTAYEQIIAKAYANGAREQQSSAPGSDQAADHWQSVARGLAGEARRIRTRAAGMKDFGDEVDKAVAQLRSARREEDVNDAAARVARALTTSNDWLRQINARYTSAETQLADAAQKASLLMENATPQRTATVLRCLEVGAPQFSVEGIAGVPTLDFDERTAFNLCSEAVKQSDEPAVRYALARAQYELGDRQTATATFRDLAALGFVPAQYHLGVAFNSGRGVRKDDDRAFAIFEETAAKGFPQGKFSLGVYFSLGRGTRADHARAGELLVESVADGYAHTITQLGKLPNATIREIQLNLVQRGLLTSRDVDGAFGPTTRSALNRLLGQGSQ
ncbi:trypsin-like peptidase domain-containing protein [Antarctobacter jejuensis]|uniref:trypsin-like peptidase domain-containing protein n=1 Tax=Antarctobacter jejuensis TaxID=1439938 RepID=UPI003FD5B3D9